MTKEKDATPTLKYSCSCINSIDDPWSYVSRAGSLSSETRQIIINNIYREPKTVTQLSKEIGLSQPAIHKHVVELLKEGLIKEIQVPISEKVFKREKYYSPTFPIVLKSDLSVLEPSLDEIVEEVSKVIRKSERRLKTAFQKTSLPKSQWTFEDLTFFLYKKITDLTREKLEQEGFFPEIPIRNEEKWIFWAEEIEATEKINLTE